MKLTPEKHEELKSVAQNPHLVFANQVVLNLIADLEVHDVINTIPVWVAGLGMTRVWCFAQDLFNFKNPFKG
jgi:hypothetical protein